MGRTLFAIGLLGLAVLSVVYGDFAMQWQPVPAWVPWRSALAYLSGAVLLACGVGLLANRALALTSRVLAVYAALWFVLLKIPKIVAAPAIEINWNGAGEIAMVAAAAWILFATLGDARGKFASISGENGVRRARIVFGVSALPVGLSHFVYAKQTAGFVPA